MDASMKLPRAVGGAAGVMPDKTEEMATFLPQSSGREGEGTRVAGD